MSDDVTYRDLAALGFPGYRAGDDGSVWSCKELRNWKRLRPSYNGSGLQVHLSVSGVAYLRYVHRLVLESFVGSCPAGMQCCHFPDPDIRNCRLTNLRWDSPKANAADRAAHRTTACGDRHGMSRLNEAAVLQIRSLGRQGTPRKSIAEMYGITPAMVGRILRRKNWTHVP